jgi:hypothetical protein
VSQRNAIRQGFDRFGKEAGGEKKSGGWYWRSDEVIAVVDLQKSQYGPQYYVNVAFWLRAFGDVRYPKSWKSHIRVRLEALPGVELEEVGCLLDLDCNTPDKQRVDELGGLLVASVIPLIRRGASLDGLRSMIGDGTLKAAAIRGPAQEKLGILAG